MPGIGAGGAGAAPMAGAATPTIVPFSRLGRPGAAPAFGAPEPTFEEGAPTSPPKLGEGGADAAGGAPAAGRAAAAVAAAAAAAAAPWFIINIVPLNFGAALFIENPHLVQV